MLSTEIIACIKAQLPDCQCYYQGTGCNFTVTVIDDSFATMRVVKRQQLVLKALSALFQSGDLHAVSIKALTPMQWQQQSLKSPAY